jgi:hypothetical protein
MSQDGPAFTDYDELLPRNIRCEGCGKDINHKEVLVFADSSGRDIIARDPYHLVCYLAGCDPRLASNEGLPVNINVIGQLALRNKKRREGR